jgi:hypothetical protein
VKRSDLKKVIKPLVKECIQEVLLEEGLLSNVVSEVAKGLSTNVVVERAQPSPDKKRQQQSNDIQIAAQRKKMMETISKDAYNGVDLFEGTTPIADGGAPGAPDLGSPSDAGVDISSIMGDSSQIWKRLNQD